MKTKPFLFSVLIPAVFCANAQPIDRPAVIHRHNVVLTSPDTLGSLSLGNGQFCYTVDITGLQSFPQYYQKGVPLGTESDWGWHSFPNDSAFNLTESFKKGYAVEWRQAG